MNNLQVITEGYADSVLMEVIGIHQKYLNNSGGGISQVAKAMKIQSEKDFHKVIIGVIDADKKKENDNSKPNRTKYFDNFLKIKTEHGITFFQKNNQYAIELCCPAIEKWLLDSAESIKISLSTFGLPKTIKEFTNLTKSQQILKNENFKSFIRELNKQKAPSFIFLNTIFDDLFIKAGITRF